ncbi:Ribosomal protein L7/L12 C-terminal domain-containing protein [Micromonospora purpureochromogenes]|uniref:Ribosomal protein L7/L12 C-terminal domain-containing protein n=1 Tax=Micromonospora purpureochromogenes TaxID=47872 RepID=A0A1C4ZWI8_9ACTN|nr:hypothetical protein [Micromonospora purpureochromogenes]SCF37313.1 Ribosomal protein L7/L12 C-terminal domain-containing protein [Micromonospora purpureochromogenes]
MEATLVVLLLLVVALLGAQLSVPARRDGTAARLTEIERRLQLVMDHLGVVDDGPALPGVREHLARGEKIKAIKAYRAATGADLKTAKEAVEAMAGHR